MTEEQEEEQLSNLCKTKCHRALGDATDHHWYYDEGDCCDTVENIEIGLNHGKSKKKLWLYDETGEFRESAMIFIDDSIESLLERIDLLPDLFPKENKPAFIEKVMGMIPGCLHVQFDLENENACQFIVKTHAEADAWHRKVVDGVLLEAVVHPKFKAPKAKKKK